MVLYSVVVPPPRVILKRSPSFCSNIVSFFAQCVITIWMLVLWLFLSGCFRNVPTAVVGIIPVLATLMFVAWTIRSIESEIRCKLIQDTSTVAADGSTQRTSITVRSPNGIDRVMSIEEFQAAYEPAKDERCDPALEQRGFRPYRRKSDQPMAKLLGHKLTADDLTNDFPMGLFIPPGSERPVQVNVGQWLVLPFPSGGYVSILDEDELNAKYRASAKESSDEHIVSQAEAMHQWNTTLRDNAKIYSKMTKMHAKRADEDGMIETMIGNQVEAKRPYRKGDYIVCGSRGKMPFIPIAQSSITRRRSARDDRRKVFDAKQRVCCPTRCRTYCASHRHRASEGRVQVVQRHRKGQSIFNNPLLAIASLMS